MSGHSKWATIKRQKGIADKKKGQIFSRLSREISLAAKNGSDPTMNFRLRLVLDRAKDAGVPKGVIERAVKRGAGEGQEGQLEEAKVIKESSQGVGLTAEQKTKIEELAQELENDEDVIAVHTSANL